MKEPRQIKESKFIFLSNREYKSSTVGYANFNDVSNYSQFAVCGFDHNNTEVNNNG